MGLKWPQFFHKLGSPRWFYRIGGLWLPWLALAAAALLITGAIWGEPMWGTWWAWDPRLTSFLILFVFYLGYMALWSAVDDADKAADLKAGVEIARESIDSGNAKAKVEALARATA